MQTDQNGQNRQSKLRRRLFGAAAALVFLWMLLLNVLTPYIADDFTFAYAFDTGLRLHSLPQLIKSLAYHYYEWSGRVVVKFFAQGFTMLPKFVFDLCNAAAYLGLGLVIYRLAAGRRRGRYRVPLPRPPLRVATSSPLRDAPPVTSRAESPILRPPLRRVPL